MIVIAKPDGTFIVAGQDGVQVAGPFLTNADAWHWIDQQDDEAGADRDRHYRIRHSGRFS